ncbi:MAG TPA: sugar transferase [Saprospiraceae bacterium]|nr:sugar transferase [Saprospiraceae bacterium]
MKRVFDFLVSLVGLVVLSPLLLVIILLIKWKMGGPVFYRQLRTGRYGKGFTICKFRSMRIDHDGTTTSVKGESRITPLGARLRKYKLDELPELWNVLIGDMSLVGPRPDVPEFTDRLSGDEKLILELRPGITGPASLKYADEEEILASVPDPQKYTNEVIWPDKVRINLEYYRTRTFLGDFTFILKTIFRNSNTESSAR